MLIRPLEPAFLLASGAPSMANQIIDALWNDPFAGIHRLVFFDYAILVPYFAVLIVLSCYGLHRYEMIRGYWKHRKKLFDAAAPQGPWFGKPSFKTGCRLQRADENLVSPYSGFLC